MVDADVGADVGADAGASPIFIFHVNVDKIYWIIKINICTEITYAAAYSSNAKRDEYRNHVIRIEFLILPL